MIDRITNNCFGCSACENICPKKAIKIVCNEKGFPLPVIDGNCIECGLCIKTCPSNAVTLDNKILFSVAAKTKDDEIRSQSTSGGVFSTLAIEFIKSGGIVYGSIYDDTFTARHIRVDSIDLISKISGSKYTQSLMGTTFSDVRKDLLNGKKVLFSGTSCQCAGLQNYLALTKVERANLYMVSILCHGVPSPKVFKDHIEFIEEKRSKRIANYYHRKKIHGWHEHNETIEYIDGRIEWKTKLSQNFKDLFYSNLILRDSCFECKFATNPSVGEITIGDFWGVEYINPKIDDNKGLSIVLINNSKGLDLITKNKGLFEITNVPLEDSIKHNHNKPCKKPVEYEQFWNYYFKNGYYKSVKKYASYTFLGSTMWYFKKKARQLLVKIGIKKG